MIRADAARRAPAVIGLARVLSLLRLSPLRCENVLGPDAHFKGFSKSIQAAGSSAGGESAGRASVAWGSAALDTAPFRRTTTRRILGEGKGRGVSSSGAAGPTGSSGAVSLSLTPASAILCDHKKKPRQSLGSVEENKNVLGHHANEFLRSSGNVEGGGL